MAFKTNYLVVYTPIGDATPSVLVNQAKDGNTTYHRLMQITAPTLDGTILKITNPDRKFVVAKVADKEYGAVVNLGTLPSGEATRFFDRHAGAVEIPLNQLKSLAKVQHPNLSNRTFCMLHLMNQANMMQMVGVEEISATELVPLQDLQLQVQRAKLLPRAEIVKTHPETLKEEWEKKKAEPVTVSDSDDDKEEAGEGGAGAKHGRDEGAEVTGEPVDAKAARTDSGEAAPADTEGAK